MNTVDMKWADDHREEYPRGVSIEATDCAHILPFSLGDFDSASSRDVENMAIIWAALFRYFPALEGLIHTETINSLENAFTLSNYLYIYFGMFFLAFKQMVI
jgi:HNH endonuclease